MSAKDLTIQNITVSEHDNHSHSFQVKFPNIFTNHPLGGVLHIVKSLLTHTHHKFL